MVDSEPHDEYPKVRADQREIELRNRELEIKQLELELRERERRTLEKVQASSSRSLIVRTVIQHGPRYLIPFLGLIYLLSLGKETARGVEIIARISPTTIAILGWAIVILGLPVFNIYRRLMRRARAEYASRNAALEAKIDPDRGSSGLTPLGDTNPEDEL